MPASPDIVTAAEGVGRGNAPGEGERAIYERTLEEEQAERRRLGGQKERNPQGELLAGREVDPETFYRHLMLEWLLPAEKTCLAISPIEYTPILKELLRRAGGSDYSLSLLDRIGELSTENHSLVEEYARLTAAGKTVDDPTMKRMSRRINAINLFIHGKEETVVDPKTKEEVKIKTTMGLRDYLTAETESLSSSEEWVGVYNRVRGVLTLMEIHIQREKALGSVDTYCQQLFESAFYKVEMGMTEMSALLEDPVFGKGIDEAMRAYVDVHLMQITSQEATVVKGQLEEAKRKKDNNSAGELEKELIEKRGIRVKFGEFGAEFNIALAKYLEATGKQIPMTEKGTVDTDTSFELPRVLQTRDKADIAGREILSAYVKARVEKAVGKNKEYVAERAEILAKRIMEFGQLTTWLSVLRYSDGAVVMKEKRVGGKTIEEYPKEGYGRFEGSTGTDMAKQMLSRIKYWHDQKANKPAGPPTFDWANLPFEGFSKDMFHQDAEVQVNWVDGASGVALQGVSEDDAKSNVSIFELWYGGKKTLGEVFRGGIQLGPMAESQEITVSVGGVEKKVKAKKAGGRTTAFPENWFDSYHFVMYKQSKVRNMVLNNERGGKDDCVVEISRSDSLRAMNKHLGTAVEDPVFKEMVKANILIARGTAWFDYERKMSKGNRMEFGKSVTDFAPANVRQAVGVNEEEIDSIKKIIEASGFIDDDLTDEVFSRIKGRKGCFGLSEFVEFIQSHSKTKGTIGDLNLGIWARKILREVGCYLPEKEANFIRRLTS